ncbi:MAG TPA: WD40 repeat domain-containing protein [Gemmataceae bacterium]|nr:WD40 repeat domain-containing protein [Gemmataceae bacterium]
MRIIAAHRKDVHGLAFAPDGRTLASVGGQSAAVWVWDARTGELIRKLPGHRDRGRAVALSPDGKLVAAADDCNLVRVWRLPDGMPVAEIAVTRYRPYKPAYDLAFLPDSRYLVTASQQVRIWALDGFEPSFREAPARDRLFHALCPSPDAAVITYGSQSAIALWWPARGVTRILTEVRRWPHSLAIAPDGSTLAAAFGHSVRVFDAQTGLAGLLLSGHQGKVWKVAYTPDGSRLVTASSDGSVRFWDAVTGALRASFDWMCGQVRCLAISPDGLTVASGGQDGRIVIADVES